ncbi:hypothetical protein ABIE73_002394 [Bradyrhizobium yuanmingense]
MMPLFCPTSQIWLRKILKFGDVSVCNDLATVHGVVFRTFGLGPTSGAFVSFSGTAKAPDLLPRAHTCRLSHLPSVANEPPFTHYSR